MHVFGGMQRHTHIDHPADLAAPHTGAIDHIFTGYIPLVGADAANRTFFRFNAGDPDIFKNLGPAHFSPFGQRPGCLNRAGNTIPRKVKCGDEIIRSHAGDKLAGFFGADFMHFDAESPGHGGTAQQFEPAIFRPANGHGAVSSETGSFAGFSLQPFIKISGVFGQIGHLFILPQLSQQPGGRPGCSGSKFFSFQKQNIRPTDLG